MGRKKVGDEIMETFGIRLERSLVVRIDKLAKKADIDRSRMVRNMLELDVKYLERVDKLGLFTFAVIMRDWEESMKSWVEFCKHEPGHVV